MKKLYYPAIFHPEAEGYSVSVPDLDGCFSQGETVAEAVEMIRDAVGLYLDGLKSVPAPSRPEEIKVEAPDFMMIIDYDDLSYKRAHDTRSVKKTLTVPSWLNEAAESAHINFSGVLQEGLKKRLHLEDR